MTLTELFTTDQATMTVRDFASLYGVGINQAYTAVERGEVPGVLRLGRTIRISVPVHRRLLDPGLDESEDS